MTEYLSATPQARSTTKRLLYGRIPKRIGNISNCACRGTRGILVKETTQHLLAECPFTSRFYRLLLPAWIRIARALLPVIQNEVRSQPRQRGSRASGSAPPRPEEPCVGAEAAPNPLVSPAVPLVDGPSSTTPVRSASPAAPLLGEPSWTIPTAMPRAIPAILYPFLRWTGIDTPRSPTAGQFHALWQLASAQMIHLLWVRRNASAYGNDPWTPTRFAHAYNSEFLRFAAVLYSPGEPIAEHIHLALIQTPQMGPGRSGNGTADIWVPTSHPA
ncbi:hypothetical protein IWW50_006930 [Coemansia erecta]|nr:hypothetical protein IWW50_006930 [Coemansia erecta]